MTSGILLEVENRSNNDNLDALLLVQETLSQVVTGQESLTGALSDTLISILDSMDSQDGRLVITTLKPNKFTSVSVVDGNVESEAAGVLPETLQTDIENFAKRHGRELYLADTRDGNSWFLASHPQSTTDSWSVISTPIRTDRSAVGLLTILKRGVDRFGQEDIVLSSLFAGQIGAMLTALQFQEDVQSEENRVQDLLQDNQDLAAILVHDLQGPLGNVLTSLEMVQERLDPQREPDLSLLMDIAVRSSEHLQALVNSLLDISRLEAGQEITDLQPALISELIDYVAEVEGPVLEQRQVTLAREMNLSLPQIWVNIDVIQRVLLNLIDNALKVSKQNQTITIRATIEDGGLMRISVVDQGPGIPVSYRERIFEKYQRVNGMSTSKGLGLGLAFCKLAVEAHGGRIWFEDPGEDGACFCFTVPMLESTNPASNS